MAEYWSEYPGNDDSPKFSSLSELHKHLTTHYAIGLILHASGNDIN